MTKLLLTSTGLANQNITNQFLQIIDKPVSQIKIIFVPTASRTDEEIKYVHESKKELLDLGILENNIKILNLDSPVSFQEVEDFDVIYVCGGNTFYLFKKIIENFFFGVSRGIFLFFQKINIEALLEENFLKKIFKKAIFSDFFQQVKSV